MLEDVPPKEIPQQRYTVVTGAGMHLGPFKMFVFMSLFNNIVPLLLC